ncbi:MAG: HNH endonuclease [Bacteroidales bacterium]|nr:HNH endonuclease [Bacteroidales bacterium]
MRNISKEKAELIYKMAKSIYLGVKDVEECYSIICKLYENDDNKFSSFKNYFVFLFRCMMNGTTFKGNVPQVLYECYLNNIYVDFGADGLKNALKTYKCTIEYHEAKGINKPGDNKIYKKFFSILNKSISENNIKYTISNELDEIDVLDTEGLRKSVYVNVYERSSEARKKCIQIKGTTCVICGFDFEKIYGDLGKGFIHVHHIVPMSSTNGTYVVNPETDLIPVCPNCHAMLHRGKNGNVLSIDELKAIIEESKERTY